MESFGPYGRPRSKRQRATRGKFGASGGLSHRKPDHRKPPPVFSPPAEPVPPAEQRGPDWQPWGPHPKESV